MEKKALCLVIVILLVSIVLSIYPIQVETYPSVKADNSVVFLHGKRALMEKKEAGKEWNGKLNKEKIRDIFEHYQAIIDEYGENVLETRPDIYFKEIYPIYPVLIRVQESFAESQSGGTPKELSQINPKEAMAFYRKRETRLIDILENDLYPNDQLILKSSKTIDKQLKEPFIFQSGFAENVIDYLSILIFVLALIFVIVFSSMYAADYQSEAYEIINRTKRYDSKLVLARFISMVLITVFFYLLAGVIFFSLTIPFYGLEGLKLSYQFNTSAMTIFPYNVGYAQLMIYLVGLINILSVNTFCLFMSILLKSIWKTAFLCMMIMLLPSLLFSMIQHMDYGWTQMLWYWLLHLLPSFGVGLMNSFGLSLSDLVFLETPFTALWSPIVIACLPIVEIPIFYLVTKKLVLKINK